MSDRRIHAGLTLIEVAFSISIVAVAVLTIFMLMPMGIRTQLNSRYKILAAAKVMEMLESYRGGGEGAFIDDGRDMDKEGVFPWDSPMTYKCWAPDLESACENTRFSLKPIPDRIAYRIDADQDEIRTLLDAGGHLYYFTPSTKAAALDLGKISDFDRDWASESRKLVVGVVGYPQQNSILYHPSVKVGPYQDFYPSPPTHTVEKTPIGLNIIDWYNGNDLWRQLIVYDALCRGENGKPGGGTGIDADIAEVMQTTSTYVPPYTPVAGGNPPTAVPMGYLPYQVLVASTNGGDRSNPIVNSINESTITNAQRAVSHGYLLAALWYGQRVGLPSISAVDSQAAVDAWMASNPGSYNDAGPNGYRHVNAMRYIAHAAACLMRFNMRSSQTDTVTLGVGATSGDTIGPMVITAHGVTLDAATVPPITIPNIQAWHELSLRLAVAHADTAGPYNWGAPRPLNRQVMMDHPLVQLDLWSDPISFQVPGQPAGKPWMQWRAVYPQRIHYPGLPFSFPGRHIDGNGDGLIDWRDPQATSTPADYPARYMDRNSDDYLDENDLVVLGTQPAVASPTHFNLTAPFEAADRCRQIVAWAVDWQSYEDFETAPSASLDSARYPIVAPYQVMGAGESEATGSYVLRSAATRQKDAWAMGSWIGDLLRNPEAISCFRYPSLDASGKPITAPVRIFGALIDLGGGDQSDPNGGQSPDTVSLDPNSLAPYHVDSQYNVSQNRMIFMGTYGANRNGVSTNTWGDSGVGSRGSYVGNVDVGPVPRSVRLRASTVGRFNYYDLRANGSLRN